MRATMQIKYVTPVAMRLKFEDYHNDGFEFTLFNNGRVGAFSATNNGQPLAADKLIAMVREHTDMPSFRVWPDGTVQNVEDGEPYHWMSDDYMVVHARNEEDAARSAV